MSRSFLAFFIAVLGLTGPGATCSTRPPEIARERAVAIAQPLVSFEASSIDAQKAIEDGRRVWRVTFRGKPVSPDHPLLRPIIIVLVDSRTGEVIGVSKN